MRRTASAWLGYHARISSRRHDESARASGAFPQITQTKVGTPMSLAYGEQGKYSRVLESATVTQKVADAIPVRSFL